MVELMVVVAIVGLLASIAIPLYDRYQARARQAEAKLALGSIYSSEKSFYSEYAAYVSSFDALHYIPEGSRRFYTVGWSAAMTGTVTAYAGTYGVNVYDRKNTPAQFSCAPAVAYAQLPVPVGTDSQTFTAGAVGEVRLGRGCDVWSIDEEKTLSNSDAEI